MEAMYSIKEQKWLLVLARKTLEEFFKTKKNIKVSEKELPDKKLAHTQGCFVTLHLKKGHELRGCIGCIESEQPLYECVIEHALAAAFADPRFEPLQEKELNEVVIEISVLSKPEKLEYGSSEELLEKLKPNMHGVILKNGNRQATFLPQVWESIPGKEEFLGHLCKKAGLNEQAWQDKKTEIHIYTAEVFSE